MRTLPEVGGGRFYHMLEKFRFPFSSAQASVEAGIALKCLGLLGCL